MIVNRCEHRSGRSPDRARQELCTAGARSPSLQHATKTYEPIPPMDSKTVHTITARRIPWKPPMGFCGVTAVARAAWFIERLRGIGIFRAAYVAFGSLARFWLRAGYFGSAAMGGHSRCRRPYLKSANNGPPNRIRPPGRRLLSRPYAFRKASKSALIVSACVVGMPCGKPL